jgi:hypothetical protein
MTGCGRVLHGNMWGKRCGLCLVHVNLHWSNTTDLAQGSGIRFRRQGFCGFGHGGSGSPTSRLMSSLGMGKKKFNDWV